jgi:hypothetical protein
VRNLDGGWGMDRGLLAAYLGVLERMAANILDSWTEEATDPAETLTSGPVDMDTGISGIYISGPWLRILSILDPGPLFRIERIRKAKRYCV